MADVEDVEIHNSDQQLEDGIVEINSGDVRVQIRRLNGQIASSDVIIGRFRFRFSEVTEGEYIV